MKLNQKQINLNGARINYLESAVPPTHPHPILFLHGWLLSALAFRPSLEHLSNRYHVVALDLPGFGRSDYVPSLQNYEAFSELIFDFAQALAISDIILAGHSMGGGISLMTAYKYPALVHKLVMLDCTGIPLKEGLAKAVLQETAGLMAQAWEEKLSLNHVPLITAGARNLLLRYRSVRKILDMPFYQDLRPILPNIQTSCLVAWGEKDRTIPLAYGVEISNCMPNSQLLVIENGYHEWSALRPEKLETVISDFIQ